MSRPRTLLRSLSAALLFSLLAAPTSIRGSEQPAATLFDRGAGESRLDWYERTGVFGVEATRVQAIRHLESRLHDDAANPVLLEQLGGRRLDLALATRVHEDAAAASDLFERLVEERPGHRAAWLGWSRSLQERHLFHRALSAARRALELGPDNSESRMQLADVHWALGHYVEAGLLFDDLASQAPSPATLARQARMLALRGRTPEAEDVFRSLLEAPVDSAAERGAQQQIRLLLVEHLIERRRLAEARPVADSMLELDPHHADASAALARIDAAEGRLEAARRRLEALSRQHPRPRYWTMLADSLERLGRNDLAEPWWQRAQARYESDLAAGDVGHLRELAELRLARGDTAGAFQVALRDLEEVRRDAESFETAAWALHQSGQSLEARQLVRVPLSLGGDRPRLRERANEILRSEQMEGARISP